MTALPTSHRGTRSVRSRLLMKRLSFVLAAASLLLINACEKHSRASTESALHKHEDADHAAHGEDASHGKADPTPFAPSGVPVNPAGSGAADTHDPAKDKGQGGKEPGAVKYFPQEKK